MDNKANVVSLYLESLGEGSLASQRSGIKILSQLLGEPLEKVNWHKLTYQDIEQLRSKLRRRYAPKTVNHRLSIMQSLLRIAWRTGRLDDIEYRRISSVKPVKYERDDLDLPGRLVSPGEIAKLLAACDADQSVAGVRDSAVVSLGYACGMRRSEVSKLHLRDYDRKNQTLRVSSGKGNRSRVIPIANGALVRLERWLKVRGDSDGYVFYRIRRGGHLDEKRRLSTMSIGRVLTERCEQACLQKMSFHDLRRSCISELLDKNVDPVSIARIVGHSNVGVTQRYDRRQLETRRRAVEMLEISR